MHPNCTAALRISAILRALLTLALWSEVVTTDRSSG
eukprot:gene8040-17495_t